MTNKRFCDRNCDVVFNGVAESFPPKFCLSYSMIEADVIVHLFRFCACREPGVEIMDWSYMRDVLSHIHSRATYNKKYTTNRFILINNEVSRLQISIEVD